MCMFGCSSESRDISDAVYVAARVESVSLLHEVRFLIVPVEVV